MSDLQTCRQCGDESQTLYDGLCEDCDSDVCRCSICDDEQWPDNHCRHVFRGEDFEWRGSGVWLDPMLKGPFLCLLNRMPQGFPRALRKAILSQRFHTWLIAPLIGAGALLELHGMPDRKGQSMLFKWGESLIEIGRGPHAEETADGYHWLASLYDEKTPEANQLTVEWIDEYLATRPKKG